jgi:cytochrome b subunit of formate dehydrogenase
MKNLFILKLITIFAFSLFIAAGAIAFENEDCMACHGEKDSWDMEDPDNASLFVESEVFDNSIHGVMSCIDCHDTIEDIPHVEKLPKVDCSTCHSDVSETYLTSIHSEAAKGPDQETATCSSCHGVHNIRPASDPESTVNHANLAHTCITCHEDAGLIVKHELPSKDYIQSYVYSVHGHSQIDDPDSKAATCNDCHGWHDTKSHKSPESNVSRQNVAETCGQCHTDVIKDYYESVHGSLAKDGNPDTAVCTDCHGEHTIKSPEDRNSTVSRLHISETCAVCHENLDIVNKYEIPISSPSKFYRESVHGIAMLEKNSSDAAACQDCHGYHTILAGSNPKSSVYKSNIPETCGGCHIHTDIMKEFEDSIHGKMVRRGVMEAPVCTDCHGEHTIMSHLDPDSPVYSTRLAKEVCGRCHDSLVINRKYGLSFDKVSTYNESYHGLASRLGDTTVANCASCHGVHNILPSKDPASLIHKDNLLQTCGECHPGASPGFAAGMVHVSSNTKDSKVLYWVRIVYLLIILFTIGGMLLHNTLIVFRAISDKYRKQKQNAYVERFPPVAIIQHLLITITFILLVLTGFSLSYPDSLYSSFMKNILGWNEDARGLIHRVSGVGLTLTFVWHFITMIFTKRGRQELKAIMLYPRDLKESFHNMFYHIGLAKKPPQFDRYDYSEKLEYWALVWGTMVMVLTGLLMWYPVVASTFGLGKIWVDVANVIHFYEAWLATLAIIIWHFFFVIFHPEEYPMSLSWITGKLSVDSMKHHHPKELKRLIAEGKVLNMKKDKEEDSDSE